MGARDAMTDKALRYYERHIITGLVWFSTLDECRQFPTVPLATKAQRAGTLRQPIYGQWCMPYNGGYMIELKLDHECINKGNGKLDFEKFVRSTLGCYRKYADPVKRQITKARRCPDHTCFFGPGAAVVVPVAFEPHRRRVVMMRKIGTTDATEPVSVQLSEGPEPQHVVFERQTVTERLWIPAGASVRIEATPA